MNLGLRHLRAFPLFYGVLFSTLATVEAQTLRVPYVSLSPTAGPLWIAYEAGFFKRNNINTELLYIPGGSTIIQAIISGDVKIANMAPPSAIGAWAKGFDVVLIASGVDQLSGQRCDYFQEVSGEQSGCGQGFSPRLGRRH